MQHQISIIIPVLNEKAFIGKLLRHLQTTSSKENISEIIVVDGGSTDGSQSIIKAMARQECSLDHIKNELSMSGRAESRPYKDPPTTLEDIPILLLESTKGRAKQMNLGVKKATGSILYFLHADSFPPKYFDKYIIHEVQKGNLAGCFRMQFDSNHWWLKLASWFTRFNWKSCRGGDQSLFITKTLFQDIGGYDERYNVYEDNILIKELYSRKQFTVIHENLKSSARMYQKHGVWKLQYYYWRIHFKQWLGADANTLYSYYKRKVC